MIDYIKKPPTVIFTVSTSFGKSNFVLEYNKYYDYIIIISVQNFDRTMHNNKGWIWNDDNVWLIEPKDKLY